jgi:hypothetical protein
LRIYQLTPAIAIQDHLLEPNQGRQAFSTAMGATGESNPPPRRPSAVEKLGRESVRLAGQVGGLVEWTYQKTVLKLETTTVGVG